MNKHRIFIVQKYIMDSVLVTKSGKIYKLGQEVNELDLTPEEVEHYLNLNIIYEKSDRWFKITCLSVGGKFNRIYEIGDIVNGSFLIEEDIDEKIKSGAISECQEPVALQKLEKQLTNK